MGPVCCHTTYRSNETPQMQTVKVYAVIGGWDYEGEDFNSLKLFDCKSTAEAYTIYLQENEGYDFFKMEVRDVIMESNLCPA